MTLRPSQVRRARSGRTVRQMTTSVHVLELHASAQGPKAYVHSIPVQNVGGSGEISHEFPPSGPQKKHVPFYRRPTGHVWAASARVRDRLRFRNFACAHYGFQTAQNRSCSVQGAYLRPSFKKLRRNRS